MACGVASILLLKPYFGPIDLFCAALWVVLGHMMLVFACIIWLIHYGPKNMTNTGTPLSPIRALRIIEGLVIEEADDFNSLYGMIYIISHAGGKHWCHKNHPDFAQRALEIEKRLVEDRVIPPWKES